MVNQDVLTAEAEFDADDAGLTTPMLASAPLFSALVLCLDTDRLEVNQDCLITEAEFDKKCRSTRS